jgi:hypothetical protein
VSTTEPTPDPGVEADLGGDEERHGGPRHLGQPARSTAGALAALAEVVSGERR